MNLERDIQKQALLLDEWRIDATSVCAVRDIIKKRKQEEYYDLFNFLVEWFSTQSAMNVQTSGSTGQPKQMRVAKEAMVNSACRTCRFLDLKSGESLLLCMNLKYIGAQMMVVRALVAGMRLIVVAPSAHPLAGLKQCVDFLSMVPLQLASSLQTEGERNILQAARVVIIGGGAIDTSLEKEIQIFPCRIYSTYGMTETLSHIAMRCLNGSDKSAHYTPLPGVQISLSTRETLVVSVPDVCNEPLETNDRSVLFPDGSFAVLGRADNVINSGGVKIQIEEDERALQQVFSFSFALTAAPDIYYGERVVLLAETSRPDDATVQQWLTAAAQVLPRYHAPKKIVFVVSLPRTENGKIDRVACRSIVSA